MCRARAAAYLFRRSDMPADRRAPGNLPPAPVSLSERDHPSLCVSVRVRWRAVAVRPPVLINGHGRLRRRFRLDFLKPFVGEPVEETLVLHTVDVVVLAILPVFACLRVFVRLQVVEAFFQTLFGHEEPIESEDGFVAPLERDRKSTRLNSSHVAISYAVF